MLILGGRYGSISSYTGKSYTEMEYDYACLKEIPVPVFPRDNIADISIDKKDKDLTQISEFIKRASNGRMCKFWSTKDNLAFNVMNSLHRCFEERPQRAWIRPDEYDNSMLLSEINTLRKQNDELKSKIKEYGSNSEPVILKIALIKLLLMKMHTKIMMLFT